MGIQVVCGLLFLATCGLSSPALQLDDKPSAEPEHLDMLLEAEQYEEFSKLLGIRDVNLVRPKTERDSSSNPRYNPSLRFGDIVLTAAQEEEARQGQRFDNKPEAKWQNGIIPYAISNKFKRKATKVIEGGIKAWNKDIGKCLTLKERTSEKDYVFIYPGDGCWSNMGKTGGAQPLSLETPGCISTGTVVHEMEHAIGIAHEQNRSDRDKYIKMLWENIPEKWEKQYEKTKTRAYRLLGTYDYYSIMHYSVEVPETDGIPAFEVLQEDIDESVIGNGDDFTKQDIEKIFELYCSK